jgi:hypothetical protein
MQIGYSRVDRMLCNAKPTLLQSETGNRFRPLSAIHTGDRTKRCTRAGGDVRFEVNVKRARRVNVAVMWRIIRQKDALK